MGIVAAAAALGKPRKTLARWRDRDGARGFYRNGVDVDELRAWAVETKRLERRQDDGRPTEIERLTAGAVGPQAPGSGTHVPPNDSARTSALGLDALTEDDQRALAALVSGNREQLVELAAKVTPELLRRLSAMGRARSELADAERRELENKARRGELLPKAEVVATWRAQVEIVRAGFQSLPGKVTSSLAAADEGGRWGVLVEVLERELHQLLEAFAATTPAAAGEAS